MLTLKPSSFLLFIRRHHLHGPKQHRPPLLIRTQIFCLCFVYVLHFRNISKTCKEISKLAKVHANVCKSFRSINLARPAWQQHFILSYAAWSCFMAPDVCTHVHHVARIALVSGIVESAVSRVRTGAQCLQDHKTIFCVQWCMVSICYSERSMEILWKSKEKDIRFYCRGHFRRSLFRAI